MAVPERLRTRLASKLSEQSFDIGDAICLAQKSNGSLVVVAARGIDAFEDIWLLDHMWTFESPQEALVQLLGSPNLRARIEAFLFLYGSSNSEKGEESAAASTTHVYCEDLLKRMWPYIGSYEEEEEEEEEEEGKVEKPKRGAQKRFYLLDEIGLRFAPSHALFSHIDTSDSSGGSSGSSSSISSSLPRGAFNSCVIINSTSSKGSSKGSIEAFTVVWPVERVEQGEVCGCLSLPFGIGKAASERNALLCEDEEDDDQDKQDEEEEGEDVAAAAAAAASVEEEEKEEQDFTTSDNSKQLRVQTCTMLRQLFTAHRYTVSRVFELLLPTSNSSSFSSSPSSSSSPPPPSPPAHSLGSFFPCWEFSSVARREAFRDVLTRSVAAEVAEKASRGGGKGEKGEEEALEDVVVLQVLIELFLLGLPVSHEVCVSVLGIKFLSLMASVFLVHPFVEVEEQGVKGGGGGGRRSTMQITPVKVNNHSLWACTDFAHASGGGSYEPVMYIGPDTLALINTQTHETWLNLHASRDTHTHTHTHTHEQHILDLCAGSGIQGIASLYVATHSLTHTHTHGERETQTRTLTAVDFNKRACVCVLWNYCLNQLDDTHTHTQAILTRVIHGSICDDLPTLLRSSRNAPTHTFFDVILLNPPYIPEGRALPSPPPLPSSAVPFALLPLPPSSPAPPSLLAYGAGGELGEVVTARVLKQARLLVNQHRGGLLCVVANMVNVKAKDDGFARRACEWLSSSSEQPNKSREQDEHHHSFDVKCVLVFGELWQTEIYAKLITCAGKANSSTTARDEEEAMAYDARLTASGIVYVCNGVLLASILPTWPSELLINESEDVCVQMATSAFSSLPLMLTAAADAAAAAAAAASSKEEVSNIVLANVHLRLIQGPKQLWQELAAASKQ